MSDSEFDRVRSLTDPVRQAVEATELMGVYQQRSVELARLRRAAIDQVASSKDANFTELAASLGLSKGRISQIRKTAPPAHRIRLGIGPIDLVWVGIDEYAKTESALFLATMTAVLEREYRFTVKTSQIGSLESDWQPTRDSILVFTGATPERSFDWLRSSLGVTVTRDASTSALSLSTNEGTVLSPSDASWCFIDRRLINSWSVTVIVATGAEGLPMAVDWVAGATGIQKMPKDTYQVVLVPKAAQEPNTPSTEHTVDFVFVPKATGNDVE